MPKWIKAGHVSVDTARVLIADPHKILARSDEDRLRESKAGLHFTPFTEGEMDRQTKDTESTSNFFSILAPHYDSSPTENAGVVFTTGGDGSYPIYVQIKEDGSLCAATIVFSREATLSEELRELLANDEDLDEV